MKTPFKQQVELDDVSPEVKSYIYQIIAEFEPYSTPETLCLVIAKDPLKLISRFEAEGIEYNPKTLKKMHRISIALSEGETKLEEEAVHEDIFTAIRLAKEKLLKTLAEIHDTVISHQDRKVQINQAVGGGYVH